MSDSTIAVTEGAGKNLDTEQLTVAATTVQRERVQIAGAADVAIAAVKNADPITEYGLVTRNLPSGQQAIKEGFPTAVAATWNSVTALDTAITLDLTSAYGTALWSTFKTGSITVGVVTFEGTHDGTNWFELTGNSLGGLNVAITNHNLSFGFNRRVVVTVPGIQQVRLRLSTAITGAGTADVRISASATPVMTEANVFAGSPIPVSQGAPATASQGWPVRLTDAANFQGFIGTDSPKAAAQGWAAHDAAVAGNPVLQGGRASAAAPADVSADGDAVSEWRLRNGAQASALTAAGALIGGDAANGLDIDVTRMPVDAAAAEVQGTVADAVADAQNPVGIGLTARQTNRTAVADGNRVRAIADDMGRQVVVVGQVRDLVSHQHTQIASSSAETTIVTAVASEFHDLVMLVLTNQTATAVNVTIKDATAGTTRMIVALAANGGAVLPFPVPLPQLAAVNNNWTATLSSAAVTVNIFAQFLKNV